MWSSWICKSKEFSRKQINFKDLPFPLHRYIRRKDSEVTSRRSTYQRIPSLCSIVTIQHDGPAKPDTQLPGMRIEKLSYEGWSLTDFLRGKKWKEKDDIRFWSRTNRLAVNGNVLPGLLEESRRETWKIERVLASVREWNKEDRGEYMAKADLVAPYRWHNSK